MRSHPPSPADLTLSAYLASFAAGRRVLWMGEGPEEVRAPVAAQAARVEVRGSDALKGLPAGGFDLAVVPDVEALGPGREAALDQLARVVGPEGAVVIGFPDAHDEQAARRELGDRFGSVRFVGQAPFHAYAIADPGAIPEGVLLDGTLLGETPPAPQRLLALCVGSEPGLDAYAVIRYPEAAPEPVASGPGEDEEFGRLEASLAERAREVRSLKEELEHRGALVQELIERVGAQPSQAGGAPSAAPPAAGGDASAGDAFERALEAEAAQAELRFRVDELEARVAEADAAEQARREANLEGTVRGLRSRLAELEEVRALAEGRLELARLDLEGAADRERSLQRELAELREQFELELVRTRGAEFAHRDRLDQLQGEERRLGRLVEELRAECEGLRARLAEREGAIEELRATAQTREAVPAPQPADDQLREAAEERDRLRDELDRAREARDGLVTRLQNDLAQEEQRARQQQEQATRLRDENERLREAMVQASGAVDERQALEGRLRELEAARDRDREALREARAILSEVPGAGEPGERHEITAVGVEAPEGEEAGAPEGGREQLRALQKRVARLQEELEHERSARRAEAERASRAESDEREGEVRRLHGLLGDRDAEVELLKGKLSSQERESQNIRQACAEARSELEELLGTATESGDPALAQRIGALLRLLGQF